jgi:phytoene dehydrogenase-like protein
MLTQALAKALLAAGGAVRPGAPVERIVVEDGKAVGVALAGGELVRARAVVAACHVMTTFTGLLAPADVPPGLLRRLGSVNVGNGFGMTVRCAASALPDYGAGFPTETHHGMQLLCPSEGYLRDGMPPK